MEQVTSNWQNKYAARIKQEREKKLKRGLNELLSRRFKSKRRIAMRSTLTVLAIMLLAFAYVLFRETNLVRQRYDNAELAEKIKDLKLQNESKKEQLAKLFDAKTLTAKAREIGLEKASQDQIINVPVPQINKLSINLQSANAVNYDKNGEAIDYQLIYKNLAEYFDNLPNKEQAKKQTNRSVTYGQKEANGTLLRRANEVDLEYIKKVKENALKAAQTAKEQNGTAQTEAGSGTATLQTGKETSSTEAAQQKTANKATEANTETEANSETSSNEPKETK